MRFVLRYRYDPDGEDLDMDDDVFERCMTAAEREFKRYEPVIDFISERITAAYHEALPARMRAPRLRVVDRPKGGRKHD